MANKKNAWHNVRGATAEELAGDPEVLRRYGDIINTDWDGAREHPQASVDVRAAQFSPFAALTGFDDEIGETARLTHAKVELTESAREELDQTLTEILRDEEHPQIRVKHFVADALKEGGAYVTTEGALRRFDSYARALVMEDGSRIELGNVLELEHF